MTGSSSPWALAASGGGSYSRARGPFGAVQTLAQSSTSLRGGRSFRAVTVTFATAPGCD